MRHFSKAEKRYGRKLAALQKRKIKKSKKKKTTKIISGFSPKIRGEEKGRSAKQRNSIYLSINLSIYLSIYLLQSVRVCRCPFTSLSHLLFSLYNCELLTNWSLSNQISILIIYINHHHHHHHHHHNRCLLTTQILFTISLSLSRYQFLFAMASLLDGIQCPYRTDRCKLLLVGKHFCDHAQDLFLGYYVRLAVSGRILVVL